MASIEIFYWMKEIVSHPNTPAYIQDIAVIIATCAGLNYLKERAIERKFDLVIKTYKYQTILDLLPDPPADADGKFITTSQWDPANWPKQIHPPTEETK